MAAFVGQVNQAREDMFAWDVWLSPVTDSGHVDAVEFKASLSGVARSGGLAERGGGFETEFTAVARWRKDVADSVVPRKAMYIQLKEGQEGLDVDMGHGAGSWLRIEEVLDSPNSGEWRVGLMAV